MINKHIRILFLLPSLSGGGAERVALDILRELDKEKYECYLGLCSRDGDYRNDLPKDLNVVDLNFYTCRALHWIPFPFGKGSIMVAFQVRNVINTFKPEIVLSFMPEMSVPTYLSIVLQRKRTFQWIASEQNATLIKINSIYKRNRVKRKLIYLLTKWTYSSSDHIIAISQGLKNSLMLDFGIPENKISVIHNPININNVVTKAGKHTNDLIRSTKTIIGVGKLLTQKGFDILIKAFAKVRKRVGADLVILGQGPLKEELTALARGLGVSDYVMFPGFVSNPWALMARANVFVLSSRWEGFGNVVVEALACRTPVVAMDCPYGPGEIITHEKNGLLVPVEDVDSLAAAIIRIFENEELSAILLDNGFRRALDFDVSRICRQYELVLELVMNDNE